MQILGVLTFLLLVSVTLSRPSTDVKYVGLRHLGKYSGVNGDGTAYEKNYYVSDLLKMTPPAARSFCRSYSPTMDLVSFESRNEFIVVRIKFEPDLRDKSIFVAVGGFAHINKSGKTDFHWISSGIKTFSNLEVQNDKMCLGIWKDRNDPVTFLPISCDESLKFMCQDMDIQYAN